jgi:hypothetical protein
MTRMKNKMVNKHILEFFFGSLRSPSTIFFRPGGEYNRLTTYWSIVENMLDVLFLVQWNWELRVIDDDKIVPKEGTGYSTTT